ncbi:MAG: hypothetical protein JJU11_00655 [Candidatus Sumerlaeia bacterium]|nr:hypothetical protein [Candidatus Sumerlaeia bacterium]
MPRHNWKSAVPLALLVVLAFPVAALSVGFERAFHRDGQTFLVWGEDESITGEKYRVYRYTSPPDAGNLDPAKVVHDVAPGSSHALQERRQQFYEPLITNFLVDDIRDGGEELEDNQGLLVWTPKEEASAWYVITVVEGDGSERPPSGPGAIAGPIGETADPPRPIQIASIPAGEGNGAGRAWLQYMDLDSWNPTAYSYFDQDRRPVGYAFIYTVIDPMGYDGTTPHPLLVLFHGANDRATLRDEIAWNVFSLTVDDPVSCFWFGWSATHDYVADGPVPQTGPIVNYMEQQVLRAIHDVMGDPYYNIDTEQVLTSGYSMGGTASIAMAHRHGHMLAASYGAQPVTNPLVNNQPGPACPVLDPLVDNMFTHFFGNRNDQLPIEVRSPWLGADGPEMASHLEIYNGTPTWGWFDFPTLLSGPMGDFDHPLIMLDHGKLDCVVSWDNQPLPYYAALEAARIPFTAATQPIIHIWGGFAGVSPAFGPQAGSPSGDPDCEFVLFHCPSIRRDMSIPAFTDNSGNPTPPISQDGTNHFHRNILWSQPWMGDPFTGNVVDVEEGWQVTLHAVAPEAGMEAESLIVDVTPRRLQHFTPEPGEVLVYTMSPPGISDDRKSTGTLTVPAGGVFTIPAVPVTPGGTTVSIFRDSMTDVGKSWTLY